jgi:hypothetical protein
MEKNKLITFLVIFVLSSILVNAGTGTITSFDDGTSNFNITENTTKYVIIPANSTISNAELSLIGFLGGSVRKTFREPTAINYTCGGTCSFDASYPCENFWDDDWETYARVDTYDCDIGDYQFIDFYYDKSNYINGANTKIRYSMIEGEKFYPVRNTTYYTVIPDSCWGYNSTYLHFRAVQDSRNVNFNNHQYNRLTCKSGNNEYVLMYQSPLILNSDVGAMYEESMYFNEYEYPNDIIIQVNESIVFNHNGNLTSTNISINLNKTLIQDYIIKNSTLPIYFTGNNFGALNLLNLSLSWNKTNTALLSFYSPSQITYSGEDNYQVNIVMNNTGDWNATNCQFQTVASGTPNYNSKLSYSSFSIQNGTSTEVSLTITNINQNSEPDERLQFLCVGTDDSQTVYSDFIDLDITYDAEETSSGGGGGIGGEILTTFKIVVSNFFAEETKQLGLRPNDVRGYCLDVLSFNTTKAQNIQLNCFVPSNAPRDDVCLWIEFDRQEIDLQPSDEVREKVCLTITTPVDILLGDQFVVNIKGTSDLDDSETKTHPITMTVVDFSQFFKNAILKLGDDSLMQGTYNFIRENIKSDIDELGFKWINILYPIIILNHILLFILLLKLSNNPLIMVGLQGVYFITLTIASMFLPLIMWMATLALITFNIFVR